MYKVPFGTPVSTCTYQRINNFASGLGAPAWKESGPQAIAMVIVSTSLIACSSAFGNAVRVLWSVVLTSFQDIESLTYRAVCQFGREGDGKVGNPGLPLLLDVNRWAISGGGQAPERSWRDVVLSVLPLRSLNVYT